MSLKSLRSEYVSGTLGKAEYIKKMYHDHHDALFEYSEYLATTDIEKIEIDSSGVVFTSRRYGVKLYGLEGDYRLAPIEILNFLDYEPEETTIMLDLISPGAKILDVGANAGWFSLVLAAQDETAEIHAFEPIASTYALLERNIKLNGFRNVISHNYGFSNVDQVLEFFYNDDGSGNASLKNTVESESPKIVKAWVKKMDSVVSHLVDRLDFVKCDVEGAELLVFQGGEGVFRKYQPIVFSELLRKWSAKYGYHPNDVLMFFAKLGYKCFIVKSNCLVPLIAVDEFTVATNYFFLHEVNHSGLIDRYVRGD